MSLTALIGLFVAHFVGDFLLQTDWEAINKGKNLRALLAHTSTYALCLLPFGVGFAALNFTLHTLTDAITSRITSRLWFFKEVSLEGKGIIKYYLYEGGSRHWFFVMIGFDQLIHMITLVVTWKILNG